ncbi:MAG: alpha-(1-_3)-arabinofuranosyltransferase family protein [Ilumatobacteraceae bacterium]
MWDRSNSFGSLVDRTYHRCVPDVPFFWTGQAVGLPDWLTQRLWFGTLAAAAGLGVIHLMRKREWGWTPRAVAGVAYVAGPYLVASAVWNSVVLLAWAGLPWLLLLTMQAIEDEDLRPWQVPARFESWPR